MAFASNEEAKAIAGSFDFDGVWVKEAARSGTRR